MTSRFKKFWKSGFTKTSASALMQIDSDIWQKLGFRSGGDVEKNWQKYLNEVRSRVSGQVDPEDMDELENENYHSLIQALYQLGKGKVSR
jgi:hypothetical protein